MKIRAAVPADEQVFQEIMKQSITGICTAAYGAATTAAWVSADNPAFHFRVPQFAAVGEEAGAIVVVGGWSLADRVELHPVGDRVIEKPTHARINAIYVKPGAEGRGLGQQMVAHLEQDIRDRGAVREVYLWATKNAIPFYQAMGYQQGADKHPEVARGFPIQVRYMWKKLV